MPELSSNPGDSLDNGNTPMPGRSRHRLAVVAEDDVELRVLVANVLAYDGFSVTEVGNGTELVEAVETMSSAGDRPALIVTDIDMPYQDGLTAIAALGGAELGVPVVVITAFASDESRQRASNVGANAVLSKPFELDDLRVLAEQLTVCSGRPKALC